MEFVCNREGYLHNKGGGWVAKWEDGKLHIALSHIEGLTPEEVQTVVDWIMKTIPKKKYRITRLFDNRPSAVSAGMPPGATPLYNEDVEEVYE